MFGSLPRNNLPTSLNLLALWSKLISHILQIVTYFSLTVHFYSGKMFILPKFVTSPNLLLVSFPEQTQATEKKQQKYRLGKVEDISIFCSLQDFLNLSVLAHYFHCEKFFRLGYISTFWTISSLYVLNCFKYILMYILKRFEPKIRLEKLYQVSLYNFLFQNAKIFELYLVFMWQNNPIISNCLLLMY